MSSPKKKSSGIYVLILRLNDCIDLMIGRLGTIHFKSGHYYYIGSALGPGGFKRVTRHFDVALGRNKIRKWHIDYLLPNSVLLCAVLVPTDRRLECELAGTFIDFSSPVPDFGCSDCKCITHLFFTKNDLRNEIVNAANKLIGKTGNESIIIYPDM